MVMASSSQRSRRLASPWPSWFCELKHSISAGVAISSPKPSHSVHCSQSLTPSATAKPPSVSLPIAASTAAQASAIATNRTSRRGRERSVVAPQKRRVSAATATLSPTLSTQ